MYTFAITYIYIYVVIQSIKTVIVCLGILHLNCFCLSESILYSNKNSYNLFVLGVSYKVYA